MQWRRSIRWGEQLGVGVGGADAAGDRADGRVVEALHHLQDAVRATSLSNPLGEGCTRGYPPGMPKVMVSFPADLLADLDREAARRGSSRSALLATAARRELDQQDSAAVDAALERVRTALRSAGSFNAGDLLRAERDR